MTLLDAIAEIEKQAQADSQQGPKGLAEVEVADCANAGLFMARVTIPRLCAVLKILAEVAHHKNCQAASYKVTCKFCDGLARAEAALTGKEKP